MERGKLGIMKSNLQRVIFFCALALSVGLTACSPQLPPVVATPVPPTGALPSAVSTTAPIAPTSVTSQLVPASPTAGEPATAAASTAANPTPSAAPVVGPASIMGIEMHEISEAGGVNQVRQSGAAWIRLNALLWSSVEPQPGQRNWETLAGLEAGMKTAASQGLQLILIVRSTPAWAQKVPGVSCSAVTSEQLPAFALFMHDLVARYSQPPYQVKYWELYNEPDADPGAVPPDTPFGCWGDPSDPYFGGGFYAQMLKMVYPQIKAADPQAQVVVGGLLMNCDPVNPPETSPGSGQRQDCTPSRFMEGILKYDGGPYFDAISFHAYDFYGNKPGLFGNGAWNSISTTTGPVLITKARYLRSLLATYGHPEKRLINTESGLLCTFDETTCLGADFENTKAYNVAQAYASALAEGLEANIWYSITGWRYSGLVSSNLQPLPAYNAFRFSSAQLQGATFSREVTDFPGINGYEFTRLGKRLWVIWSIDGIDQAVRLPTAPAAIYDVFGGSLQAAQDLIIGPAPLYIDWGSS